MNNIPGQNNSKYHFTRAAYIFSKPQYLDEPTQKNPNTHKLIEQPWQHVKGIISEEKNKHRWVFLTPPGI